MQTMKALYGLKQAQIRWNLKIDLFLNGSDFELSPVDPCSYVLEDMIAQ